MKQVSIFALLALVAVSASAGAAVKSKSVATSNAKASATKSDSATETDRDAIVEALAKSDFTKAKALHKKGVSYDSVADSDDMTGLMRAADDGDESAVRGILKLGANIDAKNSAGESAVWYAAYSGHEKVALLLISRGASVEGQRPDSKECLLHMAVQADLMKLSAKLMKMTPKCASIKDIDGHTPAAVAKSLGYKKLAKLVAPR